MPRCRRPLRSPDWDAANLGALVRHAVFPPGLAWRAQCAAHSDLPMTAEPASLREPRTTAATGVECVRDVAGFRSLRTDWQQLLARCDGATPFNTWEWLYSWWQAYGAGRQLRILLVRIDGSLTGIVPLYLGVETGATFGMPCRVLRFIGDGSFDSDHLGLLSDPVMQAAVMQQFEQWLHRERGWDALALREITAGSALVQALHDLARNLDMSIRAEASACAVLDLPPTFGEFLEARQSRFRTRIRSSLRGVDGGELDFDTQCTPRELSGRAFARSSPCISAAGVRRVSAACSAQAPSVFSMRISRRDLRATAGCACTPSAVAANMSRISFASERAVRPICCRRASTFLIRRRAMGRYCAQP